MTSELPNKKALDKRNKVTLFFLGSTKSYYLALFGKHLNYDPCILNPENWYYRTRDFEKKTHNFI